MIARKYDDTRLIISDLRPQDKLEIRRNCINVNTRPDGSSMVCDDNLFNRLYLHMELPEELLFNSTSSIQKSSNVSFNPSLRDYQIEDLKKMLSLKNVLNCNKMGYGKTLEATEYCRMLGLRKILIVCPKAIIEQWKDHFAKWWPEVFCLIREDPPTILDNGSSYPEGIIYIINYEWLRNNSHLASLKVFRWDIVICDESHKIKNKDSKLAQAVKQIPTLHKMAMTGTPILNKPNDLWSQLHWFGIFYSGRNYWEFSKNFCEFDTRYGFQFLGLTPSGTRRSLLSEGLSKISVGGQTRNITDGKNYIDISLSMTNGQKRLYSQIKKLAIDSLEEEGITINSAMDALVKLMQVTSNPGKLNQDLKNPKFEWIKEQLDNVEGKLVVFSKHAETVKALQNFLGENVCGKIIGDMNSLDRKRVKDIFTNSSAEMKVLAGTIGALGVGIDGLQKVSHTVIFIDKDWSPSLNEQAEDRVNRFGQKEIVNVYTLKMKGTIDMHIEQVVNKKLLDIEELRECIQLFA